MPEEEHITRAAAWARFRFSVIGSLLSAPPARGELKASIAALAAKNWTHPIHGRQVQFSAVTLERWFYRARRERDDPVSVSTKCSDPGNLLTPATSTKCCDPGNPSPDPGNPSQPSALTPATLTPATPATDETQEPTPK